MKRTGASLALMLAACSEPVFVADNSADAGPALEKAAIAAGVVRDPDDSGIAGLYARASDHVCIVPARSGQRIGAYLDMGENYRCSASGTISRRDGETLRIRFAVPDSDGSCDFDARLDGERILFPGNLPAICQKLCDEKVSFTALNVALLSDSIAEAAALRDPAGRQLCAG